MFNRLIHADWGAKCKKRWMAVADRAISGWQVEVVREAPPVNRFLDEWLFGEVAVLAGFDFPIGVPVEFGKRTGFTDFLDALAHFGHGEWHEFFRPAQEPEEISLHRPFYPDKPKRGHKQVHLVRALGFSEFEELRRACERKTRDRPAACPLFWTLGGNQVGKGAINGWQEVLRPALSRGARLWPFQGNLSELSRSAECVLCETYPGEAYSHLKIAGRGKRKQDVRQTAAEKLKMWATQRNIGLSDEVQTQLSDGFGPSKSGEDPFDALVGLASMIDVVDSRRVEGSLSDSHREKWEGWIMGQEPVGSFPPTTTESS